MSIRYFALDRDGIFRETRNESMLVFEYLTRSGRWVSDPNLLRYTMGGGDADQVTLEEAQEIARSWGLDPSAIVWTR